MRARARERSRRGVAFVCATVTVAGVGVDGCRVVSGQWSREAHA